MDIEKDAHPLLHAIGFDRLLHSDPAGIARVRFAPRPEFAHTNGTIVQGGFITAWLISSLNSSCTCSVSTALRKLST